MALGAKLLLRKLVSKPLADELGWDDPLPEDNRAEWRSLFEDLLMLKEVSFTRCTKPIEAIGEPTLVIFSDASMHAYGACAYAQWLLKSGKYEARLIAAKNRTAPTRQMSIPRLELCGALLGCRLRESIQNEMDYTYCKVVHIVDSTIVQAQIQKESYGFGTFVATKVAEIQNKSDPREWWWTSTDKILQIW